MEGDLTLASVSAEEGEVPVPGSARPGVRNTGTISILQAPKIIRTYEVEDAVEDSIVDYTPYSSVDTAAPLQDPQHTSSSSAAPFNPGATVATATATAGGNGNILRDSVITNISVDSLAPANTYPHSAPGNTNPSSSTHTAAALRLANMKRGNIIEDEDEEDEILKGQQWKEFINKSKAKLAHQSQSQSQSGTRINNTSTTAIALLGEDVTEGSLRVSNGSAVLPPAKALSAQPSNQNSVTHTPNLSRAGSLSGMVDGTITPMIDRSQSMVFEEDPGAAAGGLPMRVSSTNSSADVYPTSASHAPGRSLGSTYPIHTHTHQHTPAQDYTALDSTRTLSHPHSTAPINATVTGSTISSSSSSSTGQPLYGGRKPVGFVSSFSKRAQGQDGPGGGIIDLRKIVEHNTPTKDFPGEADRSVGMDRSGYSSPGPGTGTVTWGTNSVLQSMTASFDYNYDPTENRFVPGPGSGVPEVGGSSRGGGVQWKEEEQRVPTIAIPSTTPPAGLQDQGVVNVGMRTGVLNYIQQARGSGSGRALPPGGNNSYANGQGSVSVGGGGRPLEPFTTQNSDNDAVLLGTLGEY